MRWSQRACSAKPGSASGCPDGTTAIRLLAAGIVLVAVSWSAAGSLASARDRAAKATLKGAARAVVVTKAVGAPGMYAVTVVITSHGHARERVSLRIGKVERRLTINRRRRHARVRVRLRIAGHSLTVRAVAGRARPVLEIALHELSAPKVEPAPQPSATPTATSVPASTPTASTTTTTTTPAAPAPAASGPPGPGPYDTLAWSDDFTQDWASEGGGATEPIPSTWALDDYGGCGSSAQSPQESSYPANSSDAYLTSQGLVIPVTATGPTSYTSAQLDTRTISGESWLYGTVEASIQLPTGQGLCPAFWMYADDGTGEIDILEAPSFVGAATGGSPPYSIFTLHNDNTQQWESDVTPANWNPSQPNVYGVIWTPTSITWTVNYVPYAEATASSLADPALWSGFTSGSLHLLLDDAVGGWPGDPPAGTVYTQPMIVQWVKVFE